MMPIKLLQIVLPNYLSKPSVKPATKTRNLFETLLENDLKSDVARNTTPTSVLYISLVMLIFAQDRFPPPSPSHKMYHDDQLVSVQKSSVFIVCLSVTKRGTF